MLCQELADQVQTRMARTVAGKIQWYHWELRQVLLHAVTHHHSMLLRPRTCLHDMISALLTVWLTITVWEAALKGLLFHSLSFESFPWQNFAQACSSGSSKTEQVDQIAFLSSSIEEIVHEVYKILGICATFTSESSYSNLSISIGRRGGKAVLSCRHSSYSLLTHQPFPLYQCLMTLQGPAGTVIQQSTDRSKCQPA